MKDDYPFTPKAERDLVAKVKAGDQTAFNELMNRYYEGYIRNVCVSNIGNDASLVDDAVTIAMTKIWEGALNFKAKSSFATWVHAIARNVSISTLKKESRHRNRRFTGAIEDYDLIPRIECWRPSPRRSLELLETVRVINTGLNGLSAAHFRVLQMVCDGVERGEIAKKLGIPAGTVRSRTYYVRRYLDQRLVHEGC